MYRLLIRNALLMVALLMPGSAFGQAVSMPEIPQLTVKVGPARILENGAWVQGQILLSVDLASRYPYEALKLELPDIKGAEVITVSDPRNRTITSYGGAGHIFETTLALFPSRSGILTIPEVKITGAVGWPNGEVVPFTDISPAQQITVHPIDPSYLGDWWLVADNVEMTEKWSKPPEEIQVGDTVRREIFVTVFGATDRHMRKLEHGRARDISVADAGFDIRTEETPDGVLTRLHQSWDLRIDTDSVFFISPVRLIFWDPAGAHHGRASVPARRIEPLPRDVAALTASLMQTAQAEHARRQQGLVGVVAIPVLLLLLALAAILWTALPTRADRRLAGACKGSPADREFYQAVLLWGQDGLFDGRRCTIGQIQNCLGGQASTAIGGVQRSLYSEAQSDVVPKQVARALIRGARARRFKGLFERIKIAAGNAFGKTIRLSPRI